MNRAIVVSVVLHLIFIFLLSWLSLQDSIISASSESEDSSVIGAVILNPHTILKQYNYQHQSNDVHLVEKQNQKKTEQQGSLLQKKQSLDKEQRKTLGAELLRIPTKTMQQKKILTDRQQVVITVAKKAQLETNKTSIVHSEVKKQLKAMKRSVEVKNTIEKKIAARDKKNAATINQFKEVKEVNDLFTRLSKSRSAPEDKGKPRRDEKPAGKKNIKAAEASSSDIKDYIGQIKSAIQSKFYDPSSFSGKTCVLRIKLAANGFLINVREAGGDPALCQTAVSAAKRAEMPKPPSDILYHNFKNFTLGFKPQ